MDVLLNSGMQMNDFGCINHESDPISTIPGGGLGFGHVAGEVHIVAIDRWNSWSGNDGIQPSCTLARFLISWIGSMFCNQVCCLCGP